MKVLHVIPAVAQRYGGPSTAVLAMCHALQREGIDAEIVCTDADGPGRLDVPPSGISEIDGVPVRLFPRLRSESYKYSPALATWIDARVGDFDLVHIHALMSHACVATARACRKAGVPYVLRTLGTLDPWSYAQKPWRKRLFMTAFGRAMLRGAAVVHATAPAEGEALSRDWNVDRIAVIPIGLDVEVDRFTSPADPPYVLALGRLHPVKGFDVLIDAFFEVTCGDSGFDHWQLVIAGDGEHDYAQALKDRAARPLAAGRIVFTGWVGGETKRTLLERASLAALPSHHENFGLALAESMAHGVPALATTGVQIAPWIAEARAGWIAQPGVAPLASALREALADASERERRGINARSLVRRWRWPVVAQQLIEMYRRVVESPDSQSCVASPA